MASTAEDRRFQVELEELRARINESMARTAQIQRQTWWYPVVVSGSLIAGVTTIVTLLLKFAVPEVVAP